MNSALYLRNTTLKMPAGASIQGSRILFLKHVEYVDAPDHLSQLNIKMKGSDVPDVVMFKDSVAAKKLFYDILKEARAQGGVIESN